MADDENNEPKKKGGILKILGFAFGGVLLVGAGLGAGFFMFGSTQPDPSEEIEQIIERKMVEAEEKKEADEKARKFGKLARDQKKMIEKEEAAFLKRSGKDELAIRACNDAIDLLEEYCLSLIHI